MEQFQYHMRQYEEGRLQMNDDDDEEYGHGFKKSTHAYRTQYSLEMFYVIHQLRNWVLNLTPDLNSLTSI